jgi:hypothetical protein
VVLVVLEVMSHGLALVRLSPHQLKVALLPRQARLQLVAKMVVSIETASVAVDKARHKTKLEAQDLQTRSQAHQ